MKSKITICSACVGLAIALMVSAQNANNSNSTPAVFNNKAVNSTNADDEQRLLSAIPELLWTQDYMASAWQSDGLHRRWLKPGQVINEKANGFSDKNYKLFGLVGEVQFSFYHKLLDDFSFYIQDGEVGSNTGDLEFAQLYKNIKKVCLGPEIRSGDNQSSKIEWVIVGLNNSYKVRLIRRVFGSQIERGLEIRIDPNQAVQK